MFRPIKRLSGVRLASLRHTSSSASGLQRTPLYDLHIANNAQMVPFAGYSMPLVYSSLAHGDSHRHVREKVGLFDVSHMLQSIVRGSGAKGFLEWVTPADLSHDIDEGKLSLLLNDQGGILDDLIITKRQEDEFYIVSNASRAEADLAWFREHLSVWNKDHPREKAEIEVMETWGLLALQGPQSASVLEKLVNGGADLGKMTFGKSLPHVRLEGGYEVGLFRGGYTGEDGFEISVKPEQAPDLAQAILSHEPVQLVGLASRDSLRIEAGLCLYGQDISEETTPIEAGLAWVIPKTRRGPSSGYIGKEKVDEQLNDKTKIAKRRVGLVVEDVPARQGAKILSDAGEKIGSVTSGIPSPTLSQNIAMGYINSSSGLWKKDSPVQVEVRGKPRNAKVVKMPFVETRYWRG